MNILLIFFALPLATIILAAVLQKLIKSPVLVAAIFFAIYLIVAFAVFNATFLIAVIVYTVLAYVTASIVRIICCFIRNFNLNCDDDCPCRCNRTQNCDNNCSCRCNRSSNTANNAIALSNTNGVVTTQNANGCNCRITCQDARNAIFNNGYNRGYNNGYDNGYNNAFDFWNDENNDNNNSTCNQDLLAATNNIANAINNNRCGCNCRRRCR